MTLVDSRLNTEGTWLRLVLITPPGNVLTMEMVEELRAALGGVAGTPALKLLSIEGAGGHFSYGASVAEHLPPIVSRMLPAFHQLIRDLLAVPAPTAAIVSGRCLGGGFELALACDLVFVADDAQLGAPEVTLGVFPPAAAALLPWRVGAARASRLVITGEILPAEWWVNAGLATLVAPASDLQPAVQSWFDRQLSPRSSVALRHAALAARDRLRHATAVSLDELERQYLERLLATHDGVEGCAAFVEKRAPVWTNT